MTIAAGFKYQDGILLCADREITEGASKYSKSKVFGEQIGPDVSLGFVYSGSMDYAVMAIQGIIAVVRSSRLTSHAQIWLAIKDAIHEIYSDSIGRLPEYQQENFHFSLLIAVWAEGQQKLYTTENTAIVEESQYRCIGIGKDLAKYLLDAMGIEGANQMPLKNAEIVALRIVGQAQNSVVGCGKESEVLIMDSNGVLTRKSQRDYHYQLQLLEAFGHMTSILFAFVVDPDITDEDLSIGYRMAWQTYSAALTGVRAGRRLEAQEDGEEE